MDTAALRPASLPSVGLRVIDGAEYDAESVLEYFEEKGELHVEVVNRTAWIFTIGVEEGARRTGVATRLIRRLFRDIDRVYVGVVCTPHAVPLAAMITREAAQAGVEIKEMIIDPGAEK